MRPARGLRRLFVDFRRHPWLHGISISTISIALIILGVFLLIFSNLSILAEHSDPTLTGTLYLKENLSEEQVKKLVENLESQAMIGKAQFKTKHSVLSELQNFMGSSPLENTPGSDLFPDIIEIELKVALPSHELDELKSGLAKLPEVAEVDFSDDWSKQFQHMYSLLRIIGICLLFGIFGACSFIIANFMGLRHQSRKNEIDIVRLIGANQQFVLSPFLWEGIIEGITGSVLALFFLFVAKTFFTGIFSFKWVSILGVQNWAFLSFFHIVLLFSLGILMACCGSIAVFLRFREE